MDDELRTRQSIIDACLKMNADGINQGTSGNISARWEDGLLITPTGVVYDDLTPERVVFLDGDGVPDGVGKPSSEWRFHLAIYNRRPDVNAVVHTHSVHATAISMTGEDIPAVHYMIAAAGGPTIRCAPYATFGTEELSAHAVTALEGRNACLLANHGLIACGPSIGRALWIAGEIEALSHQYILARLFGEPVVLTDDEIAINVEKFRSYGAAQDN
ncbi:MAG: L-fuculose-phosphate aldolase [Rhodospirillales bacterium]